MIILITSERGKETLAQELEEFYRKIKKSIIVWINQPVPKGFGDAVLKSESFIGSEFFIVHAGDTLILPNEVSQIQYLMRIFEENDINVIFLLEEVESPEMYGVIEPGKVEGNIIEVKRIIEKPSEPPSNLAVVPIYIFDPIIFKALKVAKPGKRDELELTDAIQKIIEWGFKIYALKLSKDQIWLDIGAPEMCWRALEISYKIAKGLV